jgi:hypothetical protein
MIGICQNSDIESLDEFRLWVPNEETARCLLWHYWSAEHGQRYLEELAFRAGQREAVRKPRTVRGKTKMRSISAPRPVLDQRRDLFAYAVGRHFGTKLRLACVSATTAHSRKGRPRNALM